MVRAIPPERTVNLLPIGKEPWKIKVVNDQLATYRLQWQSDQQKQIMIKMVGKLTGKSSNSKPKNNERNNHNIGGSTKVDAKEMMDTEVVDEDAVDETVEIMTTTII
jgi:hypothetical protein